MKRTILLSTLLLFTAIIVGGLTYGYMTRPKTPEAVSARFCANAGHSTCEAMKGLLTKDLYQLCNAAQKRSDEIGRARPQEKPPLGDGVDYTAYPDDMPPCTVGTVTIRGDSATVNAEYHDLNDPPDRWTDHLFLKQEGDAWRIDDIQFLPPSSNSLRGSLTWAVEAEIPQD